MWPVFEFNSSNTEKKKFSDSPLSTTSFSIFLLASNVSTSTVLCRHQEQVLCYPGGLDVESW